MLQSQQQEHWMDAWRAKKELQLQLYQRGETGIKEELALMSHVLSDSLDELHDLQQENLILQQVSASATTCMVLRRMMLLIRSCLLLLYHSTFSLPSLAIVILDSLTPLSFFLSFTSRV